MPIPFTCPHCGSQTEVSDEYAGQSGPCAQCGKPITVPSPIGPAQYAPPPRKSSNAPMVVIVLVAVLVALLLPFVQTESSNKLARRAACINNMKQIGLAMHNYAAAKGSFPPAYTTDEDGNPMHSWRVLILPYLEEGALYDMIDLEQPWDSPNNLALANMMPAVYRCPSSTGPKGSPETSYAMIVGPGTISDGPTATKLSDIQDGTPNTIMVVEAAGAGIHWMEPRDLDAQSISYVVNDGTGEGLQSGHSGVVNAVFCDGSARSLSDSMDPEGIRAASTINAGDDASTIDPN